MWIVGHGFLSDDVVADGLSDLEFVGAALHADEPSPTTSIVAVEISPEPDATYWLRSDDAVQVRGFSNAPAKNIWLSSGYEAIFPSLAHADADLDHTLAAVGEAAGALGGATADR